MKSIELNSHLNAVSGETVGNILREVNKADVEEGGDFAACLTLRLENIKEINILNDLEMKDCLTTERSTMQENNIYYNVARRGIDAATRNIISNLQKCLEVTDNLESTECTSKYDANSNGLTDNSGIAVKLLENVFAEIANVKAERRFCMDRSLRTAHKKIGDEQNEMQICLGNRQ